MKLLLALLALLATSLTLTVSTVTTTYSGDVKAVADIDGNGSPDIVLGGTTGLYWFHNSNWSVTKVYTPSGELTEDGVAADIDGDGDIDLIVTDCDGSTTNVTKWIANPMWDPSDPGHENLGDPTDGSRWAAHTIGTNTGAQKDVRVADFDADGKLDVVVHCEDHTTVYFQNSANSWTAKDLRTTNTGSPDFEDEGMDVGDIDEDGKVDVAVFKYWLKNPGNRTSSWTAYSVTNGTPNQAKIVVADIDGDTHPDIVYSDAEYHSAVKWCSSGGNPAGSWTPHTIASDRYYVHTLQVADWDVDGNLDVITGEITSSTTGHVLIYLNASGDGSTWTTLDDTTNTNRIHQGQVVDIDGDSDLDIIGGGYAGQAGLYVWKQ